MSGAVSTKVLSALSLSLYRRFFKFSNRSAASVCLHTNYAYWIEIAMDAPQPSRPERTTHSLTRRPCETTGPESLPPTDEATPTSAGLLEEYGRFTSEEVEEDLGSAAASLDQFRTRLESFKFDSPSRTPSPKKRGRVDEGSENEDRVQTPPEDDELPVLPAPQPSPRKKSRKKPSRPYAPPEKYEHLRMLSDYLELELDGAYLCYSSSVRQLTVTVC